MTDRDYTVEELLEDSSFRRYAKGRGTAEDIEKWDSWVERGFEQKNLFKEASKQMAGFEFRVDAESKIDETWKKISSKTVLRQRYSFEKRRDRNFHRRILYLAASVLLILSMVGIAVLQFSQNEEGITNLEQQNEEKIITTDEGEVKTLRFSNGSRIILNSNTSVAYKAGLLQDETIEVSLQGEAWFETDHSNSSAEPFFSISTSEGIIRDIGTEFLVSTSKDDTKVILQDGLVEIEYNLDGQQSADQAITSEIIFVEKGEMVQFRKNEVISRESVNPTFYTSWATGYLEFNKTSIYELAEYVEQRFNVEVIIAQNDLQVITLDGAIYFNSLNGLVRSVTDVIGVPAFRDPASDQVFIGDPNGVDN